MVGHAMDVLLLLPLLLLVLLGFPKPGSFCKTGFSVFGKVRPGFQVRFRKSRHRILHDFDIYQANVTFDMKVRFDTGRKLAISVGSRPDLLRRGVTIACFCDTSQCS